MKSGTLFVVSCVLIFFVLLNTKGNIYYIYMVSIRKHFDGIRFIKLVFIALSILLSTS